MEVDSLEVVHAQFEPLPVTSEAVARETRRDPVLDTVSRFSCFLEIVS